MPFQRISIVTGKDAAGRTIAQKKALYAHMADLLLEKAGVARADVIINLVEVEKEDWSFGNGIAQYVPESSDGSKPPSHHSRS
jgi:phenylpyruvate tautomerase PptA (4-oxalocrotonate tautomerase family)